jgi:hypothetical protein
MDEEQERELRQWAVALSGASDGAHRAMGRAILMLLEQIASLRAELDERPPAPEPDAVDPVGAVDREAATDGGEADEAPGADTAVIGLRDRLRAAARRGRD